MGFVAKEIQEKRRKKYWFFKIFGQGLLGRKWRTLLTGKNTCSRFFMFFPKKEKQN